MKLEELARHSSVAARTSVSRLDLPPIGQPHPVRRAAPYAIAAGTLAVVAGGLFVLTRDDPTETVPADGPADLPVVTDPPRLGLDPTVEGWSATFAQELGEAGDQLADPGDMPTFQYYGTAGADEPFADGDLLIGVLANDESDGPDGEPIVVRSTTGAVLDTVGMPEGTSGIGWIERDASGRRLEVMVASRSFTRSELVEIANALSIDLAAGTVTTDGSLGLDRLDTTGGAPFISVARGDRDGTVAVYTDSDENSVIITSVAGDVSSTIIELLWWASDASGVVIGGQPGVLADLPDPGDSALRNRIVMWSPEPGATATLTYYGPLDGADPVALAERVIELDEATWSALVDQVDEAAGSAMDTSMDEVYGTGGGEIDGRPFAWQLGVTDGALCIELDEGGGAGGSCGAGGDVTDRLRGAEAVTIDIMFTERVGLVLIAARPDVDDVVARPGGAWAVQPVLTDVVRYFVATGPAEVQPSFEVIVAGEVVATLEAAVEEVAEPEESASIEGVTIGELSDADLGYMAQLRSLGDRLCLEIVADGEGYEECSQPVEGAADDQLAAVMIDIARAEFGDGSRAVSAIVATADPSVDGIVPDDPSWSVARFEQDGTAYFVAVAPAGAERGFDLVTDRVLVGRLAASIGDS